MLGFVMSLSVNNAGASLVIGIAIVVAWYIGYGSRHQQRCTFWAIDNVATVLTGLAIGTAMGVLGYILGHRRAAPATPPADAVDAPPPQAVLYVRQRGTAYHVDSMCYGMINPNALRPCPRCIGRQHSD